MRSPFSDSFDVQEAGSYLPLSELEMNSPLTDQFLPAMESELSGQALESAVKLNEQYKVEYRWAGFIPLILPHIGVGASELFTMIGDPRAFAKAFARWQESQGVKGGNLGVLGLNNWTYLQKKIGFHNLSNRYGIDVAKAIAGNKVQEEKLWKGRREEIYLWLAAAKITSVAMPINDEYFAYAIADFQKAKGLKVDGILGPATFTALQATPAPAPAPKPVPLTPSKWHSLLPNAVQSPVETFVNGNDAFRKMVEIIKTATQKDHFIYLLSGWGIDVDFCLLPNTANLIDKSSSLRSLLTVAGKSGVEIKIISWNNPKSLDDIARAETFINDLRTKDNANAIFLRDNLTYGTERMKSLLKEVRDKMDILDPYLSRIDAWNEWYAQAKAFPNEGSHHEKILVVKGNGGLFAFCGGMDLDANRIMGLKGACCSNYLNLTHNCDLDDADGKYNQYSRIMHDVHCMVEGKAAASLLQRFIDRWNLHSYQARGIIKQLNIPSLPVAGPVSPATPYVKVLHTFNHHTDRSRQDRSILHTVKRAIARATRTVFFEDQYMISPEIAAVVNLAVRANPALKVTIHTQDDMLAGGDLMFPQKFRRRFFEYLYRGLDAKQKAQIDVMILDPASVAPNRRRVHSKTYIFDDEMAIIGSANCNRRSMTFDSETAVAFFQDGDSTQQGFVRKLKGDLQMDPYNRWIPYKSNTTGKGQDLDIRILLNPYYNVAKGLASLPNPGIAMGMDAAVALISALLVKVIDPYPDGEPDLIVKEIEEEAIEIGYKNELLEMEARSERENEFISFGNIYESGETEGPAQEFQLADVMDQQVRIAQQSKLPEHGENGEQFATAEPIDSSLQNETPKTVAGAKCEGRSCWGKTVLNRIQGLSLPLNNTIDEATRQALKLFQESNQLPVTQKLDFVTERALLEADTLHRLKNSPSESSAINMISQAKTKIEDWTAKGTQGVQVKPQHILNSFRDPRTVWAFVLHQMAFKRARRGTGAYSDPESYLNTGAHFCIMLDGRIIQLHPFSRMIWHGNCLSPRSVAVEFEGNFPDIRGRWWVDKNSKVQNRDQPTQAQFESGRFLATYLKLVLGTTHILAHRQGSATRENDPGPTIWKNVGEWAVQQLGMTDGGPTFKCGTGNPILPEWRTWVDKPVNEFEENAYAVTDEQSLEEFEFEYEGEDWEDAQSAALHPDPMTETEGPEWVEEFEY